MKTTMKYHNNITTTHQPLTTRPPLGRMDSIKLVKALLNSTVPQMLGPDLKDLSNITLDLEHLMATQLGLQTVLLLKPNPHLRCMVPRLMALATVLPGLMASISKDLLSSTLQDHQVVPTLLRQALRLHLNNTKLPPLASSHQLDVLRDLLKLKMPQDTSTTSLKEDLEETQTMVPLSSTVPRTEHQLVHRDIPGQVEMPFLHRLPKARGLLVLVPTLKVLLDQHRPPTLRVPSLLLVPRAPAHSVPTARLPTVPLQGLTLLLVPLLVTSPLHPTVSTDPRLVQTDKASADPRVRHLVQRAPCLVRAMSTTSLPETRNSAVLRLSSAMLSSVVPRLASSPQTRADQASLEPLVRPPASAKKKDTNTETKGK